MASDDSFLRNQGGSLKIPAMKFGGVILSGVVAGIFITGCVQEHNPPPAPPASPVPPAAPVAPRPPAATPVNPVPTVTSTPLYVPDYSHAGQPLPQGVIAWDGLMKALDAVQGQDFARFTFSFTNISKDNVTILNVRPSCGCTTAQLPPVPWTIPPGSSGIIKLNVNLANKVGTLFKSAKVTTDKGNKDLMLRINILPAAAVKMTAAQLAEGIARAKADRQAVFKGDCASCHAKNIEGKYGQQLYLSVCSVCHDAEQRATMVPDLNKLNVPTNREFWRTWITFGKPGSLMPAFAVSEGGPLSDMQIASLAAYLNGAKPSRVPPPVQ
jgi:mono/diheme cytochrome c family protein